MPRCALDVTGELARQLLPHVEAGRRVLDPAQPRDVAPHHLDGFRQGPHGRRPLDVHRGWRDLEDEKFTKPMCSHINVGSGIELSIKELALVIKQVVGFKGEIYFDNTKPDGIDRKLLNSKKIYDLGFKPETSIKNGLIKTYETFLSK